MVQLYHLCFLGVLILSLPTSRVYTHQPWSGLIGIDRDKRHRRKRLVPQVIECNEHRLRWQQAVLIHIDSPRSLPLVRYKQ